MGKFYIQKKSNILKEKIEIVFFILNIYNRNAKKNFVQRKRKKKRKKS
jgi:hypothetical protein